MAKKSKGYLGNINIRRAGQTVPFDEHKKAEFLKCKADPIYFLENYMYIRTLDKGLQLFKLRPYQKDIVKLIQENRYVILNLARQLGKSTTLIGYFLWYILFNKHKHLAITAHKGETAREILDRLKLAYENLPDWLQQGVVEWNKSKIELENGCRVMAGATSSGAMRGFSFDIFFIDEMAHIPKNIWDKFYSAVYPTISSGAQSKMLCVSTPDGMNHFYDFYKGAERGQNSFVPYKATWRAIPERDEKWKQEQIANTSLEKFRQEHECEFLGSEDALISPSVLQRLDVIPPIVHNDQLKIFKEPVDGHEYLLTADIATGLDKDYSAFSVIDITDFPHEQVAVYRSNKISTMVYPTVIHRVASKYNHAYVLVENNIANEVIQILHYDFEYDNLLYLPQGSTNRMDFGIRTTKTTKLKGCLSLKDIVENEKLIIHDKDTVLELSAFKQKGKSYAAESGYTDDLVMGFVIYAFLLTTNYYQEMTDTSVRENLENAFEKEMEEMLLPMMYINDGIEESGPEEYISKEELFGL